MVEINTKYTENRPIVSPAEFDKLPAPRDKLAAELADLKRQLKVLKRMFPGRKHGVSYSN
jgi:cell division protein FtsB